MSNFPWLTVLGGLPLLGAIVVALLPRGRGTAAKQLALVVSLVVLVLTVVMASRYAAGGGMQFTESVMWVRQFGVHYSLGVDGIGLVLIGLTAVLTPVVILAGWNDADEVGKRPQTYMALLLLLETMSIGVFAATDVFLFYVLFEAMLVPMYFIIGSFGGPQRSYAAVKFLLYSLLGGLIMLAAVIGLYVVAGKNSFLLTDLTGVHLAPVTERWLFLGFFIAFAIKAPLVPFHTWLPDAAAESTPAGAVLLVGVLDKVGTFGMLRLLLPLFPNASRYFAPMVIVLSVLGIIYGALLAIGQTDIKRLIAYTSVSHFGFITLGIFAFTSQAQAGATLYMVNHGFSTGALFLVAGFLISRRGSRLIADYGGWQRVTPLLAGTFLVAGLSSLALPGLSSFVSEFMVLLGSFGRYRVAAVIATIGVILAALYILIMYQRMMTGPVPEGRTGVRDMTMREAWVAAPLIAVLLALGFFPQTLLKVINPAVTTTMQQVHVTDPAPAVPPQAAATTEGTQK